MVGYPMGRNRSSVLASQAQAKTSRDHPHCTPGSDWPSLERLAFAAIHVGHRVLRRAGALTNLGSEVEVHFFPITTKGFCDDATPVCLPPPRGSCHRGLDASQLDSDVTPVCFSPPGGSCHKGLDAIELDLQPRKVHISEHEREEARAVDHSHD